MLVDNFLITSFLVKKINLSQNKIIIPNFFVTFFFSVTIFFLLEFFSVTIVLLQFSPTWPSGPFGHRVAIPSVCVCVCVWVPLFASVKRFFVSRMRDFFCHVAMSVCVCVSVCLSVCAIAKHPLPGELKKIWSKAVSLIFAYVEYIYIYFCGDVGVFGPFLLWIILLWGN